MEDIDIIGKFWLPGQQDDKEFGRLRFTRQSGGELEIYSDDSSPNTLSAISSDGGSDLLIFGTSLFDLKNNKPSVRMFTLDDGLLTNCSLYWGGGSAHSARFHIHSIYENILWEENGEITFSEATVQIHGTNGWVPLKKELDGISDIHAASNQYFESESHEAEINNIGNIEIHIPRYSVYEMCRDIYPDTTIKLSFNRPSTFSEILKIIGYIQNLVSLATSEFHSIKSLKLKVPVNSDIHVCTQESREVIAFFQPSEPSDLYSHSKSSANHREYYCRFSYHDIGREVGLAKWIERMDSSKKEESLALSMLLEGKTWDGVPSELRHFSLITAALELAPASDSNIKQCLQSLRNGLENVLPPYIDDEWFTAVAYLRSKFIAHPRNRRGRNYPTDEAEFSIRLLELVCYSRIFKDILKLPDSVITKRTWKNHIAEQKLNSALNYDLKEWHRSREQEDKDSKLKSLLLMGLLK